MTAARTRAVVGPVQFAKELGLSQWQWERATQLGLIPARDRVKGWTAELVTATVANAQTIWSAIGNVPDLGAHRAAEYLAEKLGIPVDPHAVAELGVMGRLAEAGDYKGHALYSGLALEAFADFAALSEAATCGALLTTDEAAAWLQVRRVDFGHLVRAGLAEPWTWASGQFGSVVNLFRVRDLMRLAESDAVDWAAVRATPKGRPSLLASLPDAATGASR